MGANRTHPRGAFRGAAAERYLRFGAGDGPQGSEEDGQERHEHQAAVCQRRALWSGHEFSRSVERLGPVGVRGVQGVQDHSGGGLRGRGRGLFYLGHGCSETSFRGPRAVLER